MNKEKSDRKPIREGQAMTQMARYNQKIRRSLYPYNYQTMYLHPVFIWPVFATFTAVAIAAGFVGGLDLWGFFIPPVVLLVIAILCTRYWARKQRDKRFF